MPHLRGRQALLKAKPHDYWRALVLDPDVARVLQAQNPCEHDDVTEISKPKRPVNFSVENFSKGLRGG